MEPKSQGLANEEGAEALRYLGVEIGSSVAAAEFLNSVTDQMLVTWLEELLRDPVQLARLAASSYLHQLGFEKYLLHEGERGDCVRMHYWPTGSTVDGEDIHTHCAPFASKLIRGTFKNQIYATAAGTSHVAYTYRFNPLTGASESEDGNSTSVSHLDEKIYGAGTIYCMDASTLHRVTDVAKQTLSVSVWGIRNRDAIVIKDKHISPDSCSRTAGMNIVFVRNRFREILKLLRKS